VQSQVRVPDRPATPLFQGEQGNQKTEIQFDPQTAMVTIKMLVQDPNGYFIPNIRRDNFAVYENGVRQQNVSVEIEHSPVSLAALMEWGGRYQVLTKALGDEMPRAVRQLMNELGRQDKVAIWRYGDGLEQLGDFAKGHDSLFLSGVGTPEFSETNLYDALIATLRQIGPASGRKAMVLISSGIDTFSKARYEDVLNAARDGQTAIYVIDIGPVLRQVVEHASSAGPYAKIDWKRGETELQEIARVSGGRMYSVNSTWDLSGVYDDIMENLKVRHVISYRSSSPNADLQAARTVRIELVDPQTGEPLEIIDASGKPVQSKLFVEDSYLPHIASDSVRATSERTP